MLAMFQWVGLMENLQETIDFPWFSHETWDVPVIFPLNQSIKCWLCQFMIPILGWESQPFHRTGREGSSHSGSGEEASGNQWWAWRGKPTSLLVGVMNMLEIHTTTIVYICHTHITYIIHILCKGIIFHPVLDDAQWRFLFGMAAPIGWSQGPETELWSQGPEKHPLLARYICTRWNL